MANVGCIALIAGLVVIELNKASHPETRFQSTHGKVALVAYILIFIQWLVGLAQFFLPNLIFGSVDRAKSFYKYHRYVPRTMISATRANANVVQSIGLCSSGSLPRGRRTGDGHGLQPQCVAH